MIEKEVAQSDLVAGPDQDLWLAIESSVKLLLKVLNCRHSLKLLFRCYALLGCKFALRMQIYSLLKGSEDLILGVIAEAHVKKGFVMLFSKFLCSLHGLGYVLR